MDLHSAILQEFESNTINESTLLSKEANRTKKESLTKDGDSHSQKVEKKFKETKYADLVDIRNDYSELRRDIIVIHERLGNYSSNYVKYCKLYIDKDLKEAATKHVRELIKHGFKRQQNKCEHLYTSRVPVMRRQLEDLQLIVDNIHNQLKVLSLIHI